jgi:hypothetical protein
MVFSISKYKPAINGIMEPEKRAVVYDCLNDLYGWSTPELFTSYSEKQVVKLRKKPLLLILP